MKNSKTKIPKVGRSITARLRKRHLTAALFCLLFAIGGVCTLLFSHADSSQTAQLYLSPAAQAVTVGSNIVVTVTVNAGTDSLNTVQTVVSYNSSDFSFVSIAAGSAFNGAFAPTESTGSIQFSAGSTTPVSGTQTVATITLHANTVSSTAMTLAAVCPTGNFGLTCSAAYDSVTSNNDLDPTSATAITNGTYTVNAILPSVPTGLHATTITSTGDLLDWVASTDTGGPGVAGYNIYRNGTKIGTSATGSYTDSGLTAGTGYSYTVQAYDSTTPTANVSAQSSAYSLVTVPNPPTSVHTTAVTSSSVSLAWTVSTDTGGSLGYNILRNGTKIGTSTTTSYTDSGLTAGTAYSYTVQAYDTNFSGTPSGNQPSPLTVVTVPATPTGLQSTATTTTTVSLAWTASTDSGGTAGYDIYRNGTKIGTSTTTSYTDSGLTAGTSYTYTIDVYDTSAPVNLSAKSAGLVVNTNPLVIGDLDGDGHVTGHDLSILLSHYGQTVPINTEGDLDGDGSVTGHDLSILLSHYGQ